MDNFLNDDMAEALESLDISKEDKELLGTILFQERSNKDRVWDDEAVDSITKLLGEKRDES